MPKPSRLVSVINSASGFTVTPALALRLMLGGQADYVDEGTIRLTELGAGALAVPVTQKLVYNPFLHIAECAEIEDVHPAFATFGWQLDDARA